MSTSLELSLATEAVTQKLLDSVAEIIRSSPGDEVVMVRLGEERVLRLPDTVDSSGGLVAELRVLLGEAAVKVSSQPHVPAAQPVVAVGGGMSRQRETTKIVASQLAEYGVTARPGDGCDCVYVDGLLAAEVWWAPGQQLKIKRHWRGHRPFVATNYGGHRLRSLNELQIAALLDVHGIRWRYEQEFTLDNGQRYLPDFTLERTPGLPIFIEVKDHTKVRALAESLGMPAWQGSDDMAHYDVGPVVVDVDELSPDLRKPYWLAQRTGEDVWVLPGKTSCNQPYVIFSADGNGRASRRCPLFTVTSWADDARAIAGAFTKWPRPGACLYWPHSVAEVIVDFLRTDGWVQA